MTLQRALRISTTLLTLVAFSALVETGKLPFFLIVAGFLAVTVSFGQELYRSLKWNVFHFSPSLWNGILLIACLMTIADFLWGNQNALQASLYVLVFLMTNKLTTLSRLKDVPQLFVIGFLEFLCAAVLTVDLWYAMAFILYLLTAMWALLVYHLSCEAVQKAGGADEAHLAVAPLPLTARFFWLTNAIAIVALAVTSSIFLVMPRTGFGFFQQPGGTPIRTSGFSEKVDLGVIGAIKQDPTLVMRVQFPDLEGEPTERVYLRGAAFDHYTGQSWSNTFSKRRLFAKSEDGIFDVGARQAIGGNVARMNQEILLEALDISVLFGAPVVDEVRGPFASLERDAMGGLWLPHALPTRVQYEVSSILTSPSEEDRQHDTLEYHVDVKRRFLQLPSADSKVSELARNVTRDATTPYGMALAVKQHLLSHYAYSLDVGSVLTASPLEDFLFTRKTGYCEHYATAMVIMLRTVGVPARLVTGFLPGEWNGFGHYYTVRQQDAHAWVEVWLPRSGWVTFDPTPSVMKDFSNPLFKQVGSLVDSIRLKWDRFVIHYSFSDQMAMAQGLKKQGENVRGHLFTIIEMWKGWYAAERAPGGTATFRSGWIASAATTICIIAMVLLAMFLMKRRAKAVSSIRELASIRLYERMLTILAARGLKKPPASTPLEFSARIVQESAAAGPIVRDLTGLYYRVRFGQELFSSYEAQQAEELLTQLARLRKAT